MRAVVDTNILVRALIKPRGTVGLVLQRSWERAFTVIISQPLREELVDVLNRPRIRQKYHLSEADVGTVLNVLLMRGDVVVPNQRVTVCRDAKDNMVLEAALAGRADVVVSGDEDLLVLDP